MTNEESRAAPSTRYPLGVPLLAEGDESEVRRAGCRVVRVTGVSHLQGPSSAMSGSNEEARHASNI